MSPWTRAAIAAGVLVGGLALAEGLCRLLGRWRAFRTVRISLRLFLYVAVIFAAAQVAEPLLGTAPRPAADGQPAVEHVLNRALKAVGVLLLVIVMARLLEGLVVQRVLGPQAEAAFPTLMRQIVFLAIVVVSALVVLDVFLKTPPSALLASSVVISAVVGLSLQQTLGSVAAGVALQSESTFRRGDWVGINDLEGEVVRMTWRTIHLRTRQNDIVIIPNDHAARGLIINYSQPSRVHATYLEVGTHYRHSPDLVRRVLREATLETEGVLPRPEPKLRVVQYGDFAIVYRIKFFIDDYESLPDIEAAVMSNIWYHFRRHGIQIPFPIRTVTVTPDTEATRGREEQRRIDDLREALRSADLLKPLSDAEIETLARRVQTPVFGQGECLFRQGDRGTSCYLVRQGRLEVRLRDQEGHDIPLAQLGPGSIVGEMSLLTGEPRSASAVALEETTTIRIGHEEFAAVIRADPSIAEALAAILQQRQVATDEARKAAGQIDAAAGRQRQRAHIVHRMLTFFGIRRDQGH